MKATKTHLSFKLTMPNRGSWNSQWTGDGKFYFRGKSVNSEDLPKIMGKHDKKIFHYDFGDGWCANVSVEIVSAMENRNRLKSSLGFNGYDWMIDEILKYGRILSREDRIKQKLSDAFILKNKS